MTAGTKPAKKAPAGAPPWMVTFADLMALLLTLFVLLLSFATMESNKFKELAGNLRNAFGLQSFEILAGFIEIEGSPVHTQVRDVKPVPLPDILAPEEQALPGAREAGDAEEPPAEDLNQQTYQAMQEAMAEEIEQAVLDVVVAEGVTIVRFPDQVSFPSGSGELLGEFLPILDKVAAVLEQSEGMIVISGHTDDIPIATAKYRSNWDLSAARAISVAHYLIEHTSIKAERITVQGFADSRPLAPNDSPPNRAKNRRVEISIQQVEAPPVPEDG